MAEILGGLFSGGKTPYSTYAIKDEKTRQALINQGLSQIDAIFGGGKASFYSPVTSPLTGPQWKEMGGTKKASPGGFYGISKTGEFAPIGASPYDKRLGQRAAAAFISPLSAKPLQFFKKAFADAPSVREIFNSMIRKGEVFTGQEQEFAGFQQPFYDEAMQAYLNYALPQYAEQYRNARDATFYGLANRGALGSSVQQRKASDLEKTAGRAKQQLSDVATGQAADLRRSIEQAREQAIQQVYQAADPAQGVASALRSAAGFKVPSVFTPLGNLFGDLINQIYTQQALSGYRYPAGGYGGEDDYSLADVPVTYGGGR